MSGHRVKRSLDESALYERMDAMVEKFGDDMAGIVGDLLNLAVKAACDEEREACLACVRKFKGDLPCAEIMAAEDAIVARKEAAIRQRPQAKEGS